MIGYGAYILVLGMQKMGSSRLLLSDERTPSSFSQLHQYI